MNIFIHLNSIEIVKSTHSRHAIKINCCLRYVSRKSKNSRYYVRLPVKYNFHRII